LVNTNGFMASGGVLRIPDAVGTKHVINSSACAKIRGCERDVTHLHELVLWKSDVAGRGDAEGGDGRLAAIRLPRLPTLLEISISTSSF